MFYFTIFFYFITIKYFYRNDSTPLIFINVYLFSNIIISIFVIHCFWHNRNRNFPVSFDGWIVIGYFFVIKNNHDCSYWTNYYFIFLFLSALTSTRSTLFDHNILLQAISEVSRLYHRLQYINIYDPTYYIIVKNIILDNQNRSWFTVQ